MHSLKRSIRVLSLALLGTVALAAARPSAAQPLLSTRFVEKALSDHYEKTATDTLAYFLKPDQYKILVDTQLDPTVDIEKLKTELYSDPLPGTTVRTFQVPENELVGKFESLPHKRRILVVLSPEVPAEKEALVKDMLSGKLRLNLAGGIDSYLLRRSDVEAMDSPEGKRMPASAPPELVSPRSLGMLVIAVAALSAFLILLFRKFRGKKGEAEEQVPQQMPPSMEMRASEDKVSPGFGIPTKLDDDTNKGTTDSGAPVRMGGPPVWPSNMESMEAAEGVLDKIIDLAKSYPGIVADSLQSALERGQEYLPRIAAVIELLGTERALEVFHEVPQRVWSVVGKHMSQHPFTPENPVKLDDVGLIYRYLFANVIENKGYDSYSGMLSSLNGKTPAEIARALEGEDPKVMAIVLSAVSQSMAFDILPKIDPRARTQVLAHMSKMQHLGVNDVKSVEARLKNKLDGSSGQSSIKVDNESRIFQSMALLSPHEEEALFATMLLGDADLDRRARRYRLYPVHFKTLREDLLRDEMTPLSTDDLAKILRGLEQSIRTRVLGVLSEKKAAIVKDTLKDMTNLSMTGEFANARRQFLDGLYQRYVAKDPDFADSLFEMNNQDKKEAA
jgi:flagellar motility protein MotE (MotC chaperone)